MKNIIFGSILILVITLGGLITSAQADEPEMVRYQEWTCQAEIKQWVKSTGIPDREFIEHYYDCDDFAIDLFLAGQREGRFIGLVVSYDDFFSYYHMSNFTILGDHIIKIDPTDAWLTRLCEMDRGGATNDIWGRLHDFYNPKYIP
jgi:hypothetical protein